MYKFKKDYLIILIIILSVFTIYFKVNPLMKIHPLKKDYYTLFKKNTNVKTPPIFKLLPKYINSYYIYLNRYFIHPANEKPAKVSMLFNKDILLKINFSIQEGSPNGDIKFIIKKNGKEVKNLIITTKKSDTFKLPLKRGDYIDIIADKNGITAGDWGIVEFFEIDTLYVLKKFLIPFLWSLLFIFLLGKGHILTSINSYLLFIIILFAEKLSFGLMSFETIMFYTILIFAFTFLFVFIYQQLNILKKFKIATIFSFIIAFLIYSVPLALIIYTYNFKHSITAEILFAVFQTNQDESFEFISSSIYLKYILTFILITLAIAILLYIQEKKETKRIEKSLLLFTIILLFTISTIGYSYLRLPNFIFKNYLNYNDELKKFRSMQKKRIAGKIKFKAIKKEQGETYVLAIGESLNKYHMNLYGYMRNTTPKLDKIVRKEDNNTLLFNNAYPNYTQTMQALSLALTEANQYNNKKYFDSLSLINIFNKAGFDTYWITNQIMLSKFDNFISILGYDAKHLIQLNHHHGMESVLSYDGKSIDVLKKVLNKKTTKNRLIIIHLEGSHFVYALRYPHDKFSKFKNKLTPLEYGKYYTNREINDYDNSVYYNDYVVSSLLELLQNKSGVNAFIYFSDHAEDVLRGFKHHTPNLTPEMLQIPMLVWLSDDYKQKYTKKFETLKLHKNTLFSNDLIYDTLIGLANINTNRYNPLYDFSSKKYALTSQNALYLHKKRFYTEDSNYIYWRDTNSRYLNNTKMINKIAIKKVNTIGKFSEIKFNKFTAFIIDIYFNKNLYIGTKNKHIEYSLKDYLDKIPISKINKIYLNINNTNNIDFNNLEKELKKIENIKDKIVLLFNIQSKGILTLSNNGWKISYILNKNLKNINWEEFKEWLYKNKITSITINNNQYNFVKEKLKNLNISYNVITNLSLKDKKLKNNKNLENLYKDNNITTIFIDYPSLYEL